MTDPIRGLSGVSLPAGDKQRLARAEAIARAACAARRARVLRYPDLVERMAADPLGLVAERWSGYVPPATCQEQWPEVLHSGGAVGAGYPNRATRMTGPTEMNNSPQRAALVAICAEAWARDQAAGLNPGRDPDPFDNRAFPTREKLAAQPWPEPVQETLDVGSVQRPGDPAAPGAGGSAWPDGSAGEGANR